MSQLSSDNFPSVLRKATRGQGPTRRAQGMLKSPSVCSPRVLVAMSATF